MFLKRIILLIYPIVLISLSHLIPLTLLLLLPGLLLVVDRVAVVKGALILSASSVNFPLLCLGFPLPF